MSVPTKTLLVIVLALFLVIVCIIFIYTMHEESQLKLSVLLKLIGDLVGNLLNWQNTFPYWV